MANAPGVAQAVLEVNNEKIAYNANSLSVNLGNPVVDVKSVNVGGALENVHTVDSESGVAMVKFSIRSTQDVLRIVNQWRGIAVNSIRVSDNNGFTVAITEASMTSSPEYNTGTDGSVEIEFKGKGPDNGVGPLTIPSPLIGIFT